MLGKRDGTPVVDIAVMVASPALIMLMVGSLVWFLVDVLKPTAYPDRLLWCLSFFVFGSVLLARLTIEHGSSYAAIYTVFLAGATFLAMIRFVDYPGNLAGGIGAAVSIALMALTWWLAQRLTWDCTHLDEDRRTSGRGLLAAAGWDGTAQPEADDDSEEAAKPRKKDSPGLMGWLERVWRYQEARRKRPHTPGTWVLYFGLAALPLFALGQSLVPSGDSVRRRATLMEAAIFVGSGLGLLVTTSLMGLRRYLEQRDARVPVAMTAGWLGLGAGLIVLFVGVAAVLPRPHSEVPLIDLRSTADGTRKASKNAVLRDSSAGEGDGASGQKKEAGQGKSSAAGGKKDGGSSGEKGQGGGKGDSQGQGKQSGGQQGKQGHGKESGGNQKGEGKDQPSGKGDKQESESRSSSGEEPNGGEQQSDGDSSENQADSSNSNSGSDSLSGPSRVMQMFDAVGSVLKWVVWAVVAAAVVVGLVMFVLKGLAPFTNWAKNLLAWLQELFARKPREARDGGDEEAEVAGPTRVPFSAFSNPFADGTARRRTPIDLATYTLAALDAWAGDHGAARLPGETPNEFAARLGDEFPHLDAAGRRAADLAIRALYARGPLPADAPKALAGLWKQLDGPTPARAVAD